MVIDDSRSELDTALKDPTNAIFLVFGVSNVSAESVHSAATEVAESYDKPFLIRKLSVLSAAETAAWYVNDQTYVALSKAKLDGKRNVVEQRPLDDLLTSTGKPSSRKIQAMWGRAEAG
jgi:hypothetical protein